MKKVSLYIDLPTTYLCNPEHIIANATPGLKLDGKERYRVTISLPEKHFESKVDFDADVEEVKKV